MKNKIVALTLVLIAVANFFLLSRFSVFNAVYATGMGLFLSFAWFFIFGKILEDKNYIDGIERELSFKDCLFLMGPGVIYYLTVCGVAVGVYIYA